MPRPFGLSYPAGRTSPAAPPWRPEPQGIHLRPGLRPGWHPERLEWIGDRILEQVVTETLFILGPRERREGGGAQKLTKLNEDRLVRNEPMNAKLSREYRLEGTMNHGDKWEAYLAALYYSNGRTALLEFLCPIINWAFKIEHKVLKELYGMVPLLPLPSIDTASVNCETPATSAGADKPIKTATMPTKQQNSKAPKLSPLAFKSLKEAEDNLLQQLRNRQAVCSFRKMKRTMVLRLPGYPAISVDGKKVRMKHGACMGAGAVVVKNCAIEKPAKLVEKAVSPAALKELRQLPKLPPLSFSSLSQDQTYLLPRLRERKIAFIFRQIPSYISLRWPGRDGIVVEGKKATMEGLVEKCVQKKVVVVRRIEDRL
ncbi:hypothetical protein JCM8547_001383 [Rhodosporidiobolus lusitaniae]